MYRILLVMFFRYTRRIWRDVMEMTDNNPQGVEDMIQLRLSLTIVNIRRKKKKKREDKSKHDNATHLISSGNQIFCFTNYQCNNRLSRAVNGADQSPGWEELYKTKIAHEVLRNSKFYQLLSIFRRLKIDKLFSFKIGLFLF